MDFQRACVGEHIVTNLSFGAVHKWQQILTLYIDAGRSRSLTGERRQRRKDVYDFNQACHTQPRILPAREFHNHRHVYKFLVRRVTMGISAMFEKGIAVIAHNDKTDLVIDTQSL